MNPSTSGSRCTSLNDANVEFLSPVRVAERRFDQFAATYQEVGPPTEKSLDLLNWVEARVFGEVASVWQLAESTKYWFDIVCAPAVEKALANKRMSCLAPANHVALLEQILAATGDSKEEWSRKHRFGRSTTFDWQKRCREGCARRVNGYDGDIEHAIEEDAKKLGLIPVTSSD